MATTGSDSFLTPLFPSHGFQTRIQAFKLKLIVLETFFYFTWRGQIFVHTLSELTHAPKLKMSSLIFIVSISHGFVRFLDSGLTGSFPGCYNLPIWHPGAIAIVPIFLVSLGAPSISP